MSLDLDPNFEFRDWVTHMVPSSGEYDPEKPRLRRMFTGWWQTLIALVADQEGLTLPNMVITFEITGGDENDIVAEASAEIPESGALFILPIAESNTGPVTINSKPLLLRSGSAVPDGYLTAGPVLFVDAGAAYMLLSYGDVEALQSDAEAALADLLQRYLGAYADDSAATAAAGTPVTGQLYWNTSDETLEVWNGSGWVSATQAAANVTFGSAYGDGSETEFTLPANAETTNTKIFVDGRWITSGFTLSAGALVFDEAIGDDVPIDWEILEIVPLGATTASLTSVGDAGGYFEGDTVEAVLQEVGALVAPSVSRILTPERFGAAGDGGDDRAAILQMLDECATTGKEVDWGSKTFSLSDKIDKTFANRIRWRGDGAVLKLMDAAPFSGYVAEFYVDEHAADIRGLAFDGNMRANAGLALYNPGGMAEADIGDLYLEDVSAINTYKPDTLLGSAIGIRISGGFRVAHIVRPRIKNILMAEDSGVPGSAGCAGLVLNAYNGGEARHIIIDAPHVEDVKSEDIGYAFDQDGIHVTGLETVDSGPNGATLVINRPMVKNCGGRSIKIQRHDATVNDPQFFRDADGAKTGGRALIEIDFQHGSGKVYGGHAIYADYAVDTCINFTLRDSVSLGAFVTGFTWECRSGSFVPLKIVERHGGSAHEPAPTRIRDVCGVGDAVPILCKYLSNTSTSGHYAESLSVQGCGGPIGSSLVDFVGVDSPTVDMLLTDNYATGSSPALVATSGSGAVANTTGSANNRNFTS